MSNPAFRVLTITIPALGMSPFHCPYNNMAILALTGGTARMKWGDSSGESEQEIYAGLGFELEAGETMGRLELYNPGGTSVVVVVAVGMGKIFDRRLILAGGALPVSLAAASTAFSQGLQIDVRATPSIPANANRKGLDIRNTGAVPLFIRNAAFSSGGSFDYKGFRLNPGEVYTANTTAAIYFHDDTGLGASTQYYNYLEFT
jgi:hypothetical protein